MVGELIYSPILLESPDEQGLILCDGSDFGYSDPDYVDLFAFIGYIFGQVGTYPNYRFKVPDYHSSGYFLRPCVYGRDVGDIEYDQNKSHTHTGNTGTESQTHHHDIPIKSSSNPSTLMTAASGGSLVTTYPTNDESQTHTHSFTSGSSGGSECRPLNKPVFVYIRFKEVLVSQTTIDQIQYIYDEIDRLLSYIVTP